MLADLLLEIKKLHSRDLADLALNLDEFAKAYKIIQLKEKISSLERTSQSPRNEDDSNELKTLQETYNQLLLQSGLSDKVREILYKLAGIDKITREAVHYAKYANSKDEEPVNSEEFTTAWLNQIPLDKNLLTVYSKLIILNKILKKYSLDTNIEEHLRKLIILENYIKIAYMNLTVPKYQEIRDEIIRQRDKELELLPPEKTLAAQHSNCKKLRTFMDRQLAKDRKELTSITDPESPHKSRLEKDIEGKSSVLRKHDAVEAEQAFYLRAIEIVNAKANAAIELLEPSITEITKAREEKFKIALKKKKDERDNNFLARAKEQYAATLPAALDDLPAPVFLLSSRGSSDGSRSPKGLLKNLSDKILGSNIPAPPIRPRTNSPALELPKRPSSNALSLFLPSPSRLVHSNSPAPQMSPGSSAVKPAARAEDLEGEKILTKRREADAAAGTIVRP